MKQLLWVLAVLGVTASVASAGPNAGGVLWVHDAGIVYSSFADLPLPPVSETPADCAHVDNQQDADGVERIWKVYAAFPSGSSPRLKTTGWGIQFPEVGTSASSYVNVTGGGLPDEDGAGTDFALGDLGFPTTSGGMVGQSFPTGPRLTTVVALYWFYGFGYHASGPLPTFSLVQHTFEGNRVFGDDGRPPHEDPITAYGSLGFGQAGTTPCPTGDPDGACCSLDGSCVLTKQAACTVPSTWHMEWYVCAPNPCPQPTGACCYADGHCQTVLEATCSGGGGVYQGNFVSCAPTPCQPAAACCLPSGSCLIRTQSACGTIYPPGTWRDDLTSCEPNSCSFPPGSCCFPAGTCTVGTETACTGGVWTVSGTCTPNTCPAPNVEGACCSVQRTCSLTLQAACESPNQWHVEWPACDPNECLALTGACCALDGTCNLTTVSTCDPPLTWRGDLTSCAPNSCPLLPTERSSWGQIKNRYH